MTEPSREAMEPRPFQIIVCKVCRQQMNEYNHGYLGCDCKGWGNDLDNEDTGTFDKERHELVEVVPKAQALVDAQRMLKLRISEHEAIASRPEMEPWQKQLELVKVWTFRGVLADLFALDRERAADSRSDRPSTFPATLWRIQIKNLRDPQAFHTTDPLIACEWEKVGAEVHEYRFGVTDDDG